MDEVLVIALPVQPHKGVVLVHRLHCRPKDSSGSEAFVLQRHTAMHGSGSEKCESAREKAQFNVAVGAPTCPLFTCTKPVFSMSSSAPNASTADVPAAGGGAAEKKLRGAAAGSVKERNRRLATQQYCILLPPQQGRLT